MLGVLQASFTSDQLQECVETSLVNGLKRSSGLNLISFAMNLNYSHQHFFDMIQWLQSSLRDNQMQVYHYLTGTEGSGDNVQMEI